MRKFKKVLFSLLMTGLILLGSLQVAYAHPAPNSNFYVYDETGTVSEQEQREMSVRAEALYQETGAQVVLVIVKTLDGKSEQDYAYDLFNDWGIGSKEKSNGVLILVATEDRRFQMMTGPGIEHILTARYLGTVRDKTLVPALKANDYNKAVTSTFNEIYETVKSGETPTNGNGSSGNIDLDIDMSAFVESAKYLGGFFLIVVTVGVFALLLIDGVRKIHQKYIDTKEQKQREKEAEEFRLKYEDIYKNHRYSKIKTFEQVKRAWKNSHEMNMEKFLNDELRDWAEGKLTEDIMITLGEHSNAEVLLRTINKESDAQFIIDFMRSSNEYDSSSVTSKYLKDFTEIYKISLEEMNKAKSALTEKSKSMQAATLKDNITLQYLTKAEVNKLSKDTDSYFTKMINENINRSLDSSVSFVTFTKNIKAFMSDSIKAIELSYEERFNNELLNKLKLNVMNEVKQDSKVMGVIKPNKLSMGYINKEFQTKKNFKSLSTYKEKDTLISELIKEYIQYLLIVIPVATGLYQAHLRQEEERKERERIARLKREQEEEERRRRRRQEEEDRRRRNNNNSGFGGGSGGGFSGGGGGTFGGGVGGGW